jgi:hypothetical protein
VLNFLCFTKTSVIVDNNFCLGELTGFGEWAMIEIPEFFRISLSLVPIRDWEPVGEYEDGEISIVLEDAHLLSLVGMGLGPAGQSREGPITVYGELAKIQSAATDQDELTSPNSDPQFPAAIRTNVSLAIAANPYRTINRASLGVDSLIDPVLRNLIEPMLTSGKCG